MVFNALSSMLNILTNAATIPSRTLDAWKDLPRKVPKVSLTYNKVRQELWDLGLLADGVGLDEIELFVAALPSMGEAGYVFDNGLR